MKQIGISVYPDFYSQEDIKKQLDVAIQLGYKVVFTSLQLGDLGFENATVGIKDEFLFLFDYCHEFGLEVHVDINDRMMEYIGANENNLKPIADLKIRVLRLDGGFSDMQAAIMTKNPYGIIIEENASMLQYTTRRIETIVEHGNVRQYYACHNFFPLDNTGIGYDDALVSAKLFKSYGARVGIFIGSLHADTHLNAIGHGIPTIEDQRYKPSHVQAMELFVHDEYDYVVFGDSNPSLQELTAVSEVAKNNNIKHLKEKYDLSYVQEYDLEGMYCVELPVWFNHEIDSELKEMLTSIVFISRSDQPSDLVRATQSRDVCGCVMYNPIKRSAYSLVLNNERANRYNGELQIPLVDLDAVRYCNVIGMVQPHAKRLVELTKYSKVMFVLKEV